ncbi:hypothetical protein BDD12DRAFT_829098 [Trichophaea hybrida]|nr:hypothetical protein BDD12DRAFT_829098 [Trichophaea hybrida]
MQKMTPKYILRIFFSTVSEEFLNPLKNPTIFRLQARIPCDDYHGLFEARTKRFFQGSCGYIFPALAGRENFCQSIKECFL